MALSGLAMVLFVVLHMAGHMQIFAGKDAYNGYAHLLQGLSGLLWFTRVGLLGVGGVHVLAAFKLNARNAAARPDRYAVKRDLTTTLNARTMLVSGYTLLAFIGYHLAHFTVNAVHAEITTYGDPSDPIRDVYSAYVTDFQNPLIFVVYVGAMLGLSMHLSHAVSSTFRTLGVMRGKYRAPLAKVGPVVGIATGIGFLIPPLACLLGIVTV